MTFKVDWDIIVAIVLMSAVIIGYLLWVLITKQINTNAVLYFNYQTQYDLLVTSPFISILWRTIIRGILALYCLSSLIYTYVEYGRIMIQYYTIWNFTFLILYFWGSTYLSLRMYLSIKKICLTTETKYSKEPTDPIAPTTISTSEPSSEEMTTAIDSMPFLLKVIRLSTWFFGWLEMCVSVIVVLINWTLLYIPSTDKKSFFHWDDINMHMLNLPMIYFDFMTGQQPFQFHLFAVVLVVPLLYAYWSWVTFNIFATWPYSFLNTLIPTDSGYYIVVALCHLVFWSVVTGFYVCRQRCIYHQPYSIACGGCNYDSCKNHPCCRNSCNNHHCCPYETEQTTELGTATGAAIVGGETVKQSDANDDYDGAV